MYEVSKYATQQPFIHLNLAFNKFFRDLKQGKLSYPKFKKKKDNQGSFYLGGDIAKIINKDKAFYLHIPNLGYVKMRENLRFKGKINSITLCQKANKYYASFSVEVSNEEFHQTHKLALNSRRALGVDIGLNSFASLSNGLSVKAPKPLNKLTRKLKRIQRKLSKKIHPKTKGDTTRKSKNYLKHSLKLSKIHQKIKNTRNDFLHKLTTILIRHYAYFGIENLNIQGMMKNHHLAKTISDVSFYEFKRMLTYKAEYYKRVVIEADTFYPSSKQCFVCKSKKEKLTLSQRVYQCENCGSILDRDYNASLNLQSLAQEKVGLVQAEFTPEDLAALLSDLEINHLVTSKVETGIQQKLYL